MTLLSMIFVIAIVGVIVWLVLQLPMPVPFKNLIIGLAVIFVIVWIAQTFGLFSGFGHIRVR